MGEVAKPCSAVDRGAVVVTAAHVGDAGVESDANPDGAWEVPRFGLEGALEIDGCTDGVGCVRKDDEATIAFAPRADVDAVACPHDAVDDLVVANHGDA